MTAQPTPPQPTMRALLDHMAAGRMTVDQVAEHVRARRWPARKPASDAEVHGVADTLPPGDDDWGAVEQDSRVTPGQYAALAAAHSQACAGR